MFVSKESKHSRSLLVELSMTLPPKDASPPLPVLGRKVKVVDGNLITDTDSACPAKKRERFVKNCALGALGMTVFLYVFFIIVFEIMGWVSNRLIIAWAGAMIVASIAALTGLFMSAPFRTRPQRFVGLLALVAVIFSLSSPFTLRFIVLPFVRSFATETTEVS